jgi:serine/threonine protein kinase
VPQFLCPSCSQYFPEAGYCPFDGTRLTASPDAQTQPSSIRAVSAHEDGNAAAMASFGSDPRAEYDRLIGQTLEGRYYIERKIGEGGMGVVFAARHAIIERPLAIKVLKKEVARDTATVKRFVQEAKAASRIGHPNIVDVTDFGATPDGLTYSVMEYVDGVTLSAAIRKSAPFKLARALPIAAQIARALGAAHAKGIVHRDLKPENVFLVNRDGRHDFVKIVDFGIAKVTPVDGPSDGPRLTRAGAVFGTPEYMAPEQAAGRNDTDGRVDVYALGIIMYEMVTGKVPHKADSMVRTLAMQMLDPIIPPSKRQPAIDLPPAFEAVLMKALAKKREERYQSMEALLTDLERSSGGIPLEQPVSASVKAPAPAYTVGTLPPGADRSAVAAQLPTRRPAAGLDTPTAKSSPPPGSKPIGRPSASHDAPTQRPEEGPRATSKRVANEPAFVTRPRPPTYDHIDDDQATEPPPRASRWPLLVALFILFAGGGVAAALFFASRGGQAVVPPDAAPLAVVPPDAAAAPPADATSVVVEIPLDAGAEDPADAGTHGHHLGLGRADAGVGPRRTAAVEIITKPDEGVLYIGTSYRGPSGVTIEEPFGTKARIKCTHPGYEPGYVEVVFDGKTEVALCLMTRIKRCVAGIKNPFDDCPEP